MEYFETGNRGHYRHLCPQGRGLLSLYRSASMVNEERTTGQVKRSFARLIATFLPVCRRFLAGFEWKDPSGAMPNVGQGRYHTSSDQTSSRWSRWKPTPTTPFLTSSFFLASLLQSPTFFFCFTTPHSLSLKWCRLAASYNAREKRKKKKKE